MKLYELFDVINECTNVILVEDETYRPVVVYDGRNSIPEEYNDRTITAITVGGSPMGCRVFLKPTR